MNTVSNRFPTCACRIDWAAGVHTCRQHPALARTGLLSTRWPQ